MNQLNSLAISVCTAMVVGGVVCILRPPGRMGNGIKIFSSIFILCVCISSIVNFDDFAKIDRSDFSFQYEINQDLNDYVEENILLKEQETLAVKLGDYLGARGITDYSVKFIMSDEKTIECINIYTKSDTKNLEEFLESKINIDIKVFEE